MSARGAGRVARLVGLALLALAPAGAAGCGDGDGAGAAGPGDALRPGEGGTLAFALASEPDELDPLLAEDRASQVVTRQVHEPLVASLSGPFGDVRRLPGLAETYEPSGDRTIWRFELRRHVRFRDGTPFNASAVLANAERWRTLPEGRELLPDLIAIDAPRPDLVRFFLAAPDPDFPQRLSISRLGLVSPAALRPRSGTGARLAGTSGTGTGPFELRQVERGRALIVRNVRWWGSRFQLGPALDQVDFPVARGEAERLAMLRAGQVQVADDVSVEAARSLRRDPLLTYAGDGAPYVAFERSVRGLEEGGVPVLSGVWLTTIGAGTE